MDALAGLFDGPRANGAFLLRALMAPPWSVRVQDKAPLTMVAMTAGNAWACPEDGGPVPLRPGDIALMRGPDPYTVADDPDTPPQMVVHEDQRCESADGTDVHFMADLGVRTWGNAPDGPTSMLIGTYQMRGEVSGRLLAALPPMLVVPREDFDSPLLALLDDEIGRETLGQAVVLDRILDLLLVAVLRAWFMRPEADPPSWCRAQADPVVGRAVRLMQADPARPWTVADLAAATGVSRATLARRFTELVGEPPMAFLSDLRLTMAADMLRQPDATVGSVARRVGYGSSFALSTAFKRVHGVSPREHRRAVVGAGV